MELSEFHKQYHWLNGLHEYFTFTGKLEEYEIIHKALYHDNWYRKRDILLDLNNMPNSNPQHYRAWINTLLHDKLDVELKPQLVANLIRKIMREDSFMVNLTRFINYFVEKEMAAMCPDLGDFLSRGQVKSKIWMVEELEKIVDGNLGTVVFYGGWYNFVAHFLFEFFDLKKVYSIDWNEDVVDPSKRLYLDEVNAGRFTPMSFDVSELEWKDDTGIWYMDWDKRQESIDDWMQKQQSKLDARYQEMVDAWLEKQENLYLEKRQEMIDDFMDKKAEEIKQGVVDKLAVIDSFSAELKTNMFADKESIFEEYMSSLKDSMFKDKEATFENYGWRKIDDVNLVINTSCEHMDNTWFEKLPQGQMVLLQTNDYCESEQHSNCCEDLEAVKAKYPMSEILYAGELDTQLYNRFMLIGIK